MVYVSFQLGCSLFAALNAAASVHCWHLSRRRPLLVAGVANTFMGAVGVVAYPVDPHYGNVCAAAGAGWAACVFFAHAVRTPRFWHFKGVNFLYAGWVCGLAWYAWDKARWATALRFD